MSKINDILSIKYDKKRNNFKEYLVDKTGKTKESSDEIICYVDKRRLVNNHFYCYGINDINRSIAKIFKLNKKIHYVIQDMEFDEKGQIVIFGYDYCIVTIKNCTFNSGLRVYVNGTCNIENCHIVQLNNKLDISAKNLNVNNMIVRKEYPYSNEDYNIIFSGENSLNINNSDIGDLNTNVLLSSSNGDVNINKSRIISNNVSCKGVNIFPNDNTIIDAKNILNIHSENIPEVCIMPSLMIYNDSNIKGDAKKNKFKKYKRNL